MTSYNSNFFNKMSFLKFLNTSNFMYSSEHFNKNSSILNFLPSTSQPPLNYVLNSSKSNFKEYDFNPHTKSKTLLPNLYSQSGDFFKVLNLKSSGQSISTQEKSSRDLNKTNPNLSFQNNYFFTEKMLFNNTTNTPFFNTSIYNSNNLGWNNLVNSNLTLSTQETAPMSSVTNFTNLNSLPFTKTFNKTNLFLPNQRLLLLNSKEESAPSYVFNNYWLSYLSNNTPLTYKYTTLLLNSKSNFNFYLPYINLYAGYDFPNLQGLEIVEDSF
jgi:hypothetical protein